MSLRIRTGSLYFLRPFHSDATDPHVTCWKNYLVRVIQPTGHPSKKVQDRYHVETRQGEFIGLVLVGSLQRLDRKTKNALRREARRAAQVCK